VCIQYTVIVYRSGTGKIPLNFVQELKKRHKNFHRPREDVGGSDGARRCAVLTVGSPPVLEIPDILFKANRFKVKHSIIECFLEGFKEFLRGKNTYA
jgi:hypothetical protein